MNKIQCKLYDPSYRSQVLELLSRCFDEPPIGSLDPEQLLLGFEQKILIGLAGYSRNRLHERIVKEILCVDTDYRRRGFGTILHRQLRRAFPPRASDLALDFSCFSGDLAAQGFIESLGFQKYLDCYVCTLDIADFNFCYSHANIFPLPEVKSSLPAHSVRDYFVARYTEEHEKFLPVTDNIEVCREILGIDDQSNFAAVCLREGKIQGLSFFEPEFPDSDCCCINGYASGDNTESEAKTLIALYSFQLKRLKQAGFKKVYLEIDSTERICEHLLQWIPPQERLIFQRFRLALNSDC